MSSRVDGRSPRPALQRPLHRHLLRGRPRCPRHPCRHPHRRPEAQHGSAPKEPPPRLPRCLYHRPSRPSRCQESLSLLRRKGVAIIHRPPPIEAIAPDSPISYFLEHLQSQSVSPRPTDWDYQYPITFTPISHPKNPDSNAYSKPLSSFYILP